MGNMVSKDPMSNRAVVVIGDWMVVWGTVEGEQVISDDGLLYDLATGECIDDQFDGEGE